MRPIWRRSDVDTTKEYVLLLIEGDSGDREFEIRDVAHKNDAVKDGRCLLMTEVIPIDLVLRGDIFGIAETVYLTNGARFGFDSNAKWYTDEEHKEFIKKFHSK